MKCKCHSRKDDLQYQACGLQKDWAVEGTLYLLANLNPSFGKGRGRIWG